MSKPKTAGGQLSLFSPLYLVLALLTGFTASVSSWFTEHLTVAGMGLDFVLSALLRSASAYILLLLLDFLIEAIRPYTLTRHTAPSKEASPRNETDSQNTRKTSSGLSGSTAKIPASSIGLSGNLSKVPTKELPKVIKVFPNSTNAPLKESSPVPKSPVKEPANVPKPSEKAPAAAGAFAGTTFALFFFASLLVFVPAFLALFPGYTAYDTPMQMEQFFTQGILNATQPVPLTLLFAACLHLGVRFFHSANAGLLLHTSLQLLFNAICLSCVGCLFVRWGLKRRLALLFIILLEALPFVQIFALTTAKDGFFSPLFALWLAFDADLFLRIGKRFPKPKILICYGLISLAMILTRPQGKYLFLAAILVLFLLLFSHFRKKNRPASEGTSASSAKNPHADHAKASLPLRSCALRLAALAAVVLLTSTLITGPMYRAAGVYPASPSEMLSVPIQQMTRVVALRQGELSPEELAVYDTYLDRSKVETNYIPQISDLMKMSPVFNKAAFAENKKDFFLLWLKLFKKFPTEYADALLYLTDGYFYQGIGYYHNWAGLADEFIPGPAEYATHAVSLFPAYRSFLLETVGKTFAVNVPVVRRFCLISLPFWVLAAVGSVVLRKRRPAAISVLFLLVLYFGTLLLGPVCTVRYVIPLAYAAPVLIALLLTEPERKKRNS